MSESLDLGGIFAVADISTAAFDRKYALLVRQMSDLAVQAESASGGFVALDEGLAGVSASATKATSSLGRTAKVTTDVATAEDKAIQTAIRHAQAMDSVNRTMLANTQESKAVQRATLQLIAAQDRLVRAQQSGRATAAQLAAAQSSVIGAEERLVAVQREAAAATAGLAGAQREAAVASRGLTGGLAGTAKMAGELGLLFGAFELVKKGIDITKQANDFHRAMVQVQTNADVSATEVNKASSALLAMAGPVAAAPAELATAWYHAKSVGLDYATSLDVTRIAAEGARVGHADLEQTMNALTSTVASGIPGVQDMSSAMGQLITIVGSGDMKLSDLNDALGTGVLVRMKQYGLSLTDVGAALATFGDNNIRGADAATLLRMSVEAMAKQGKPGEAALARIGIKANQLRDDLAHGGLNKAVIDLNNHLKKAGITGNQVGGFLIDAFTKKGGGGVAVLLGQFDRLEQKFKVLRSSGASFGDKWRATQQTASFALASLGHGAEAAGIKLTAKLGPSIATVATYLSTNLPHAISVVQAALSPMEHLVGGALVVAWHALAAVLSVAAAALGTIGHIVASNNRVVGDFSKSVLAIWAAFAGFSIAVRSLALVNGAVVGTIVRLRTLAAATREVALGQRAMSLGAFAGGIAAIGVAGYAAGRGLNSLIEKDNTFAHVMDNMGNLQKTFAGALNATNGALDNSVRTTVAAQLQASGLADKAHKAGISLTDLTGAVTGGDKALAALGNRWKKDGAPSDDTIVALALMGKQYQATAADAKDLGTVTEKEVTPAQKAAAHAMASAALVTQAHANVLGVTASAYSAAQKAAKSNTAQTNAQTLAFQLANDAASLLQNALNGLAGVNLSVATAQTGLRSANLGVAAAFKQNGRAIDGNSAKAVANQQAVQGQIQAAQQYAEAVGKQTGSSVKATAALASSKTALEAQLRAQGNLTPAVQAYIDKLYNLKNLKVPPTKLDADTAAAQAKITRIHDELHGLGSQVYTATVSLQINSQNVGKSIHDAVNGLGSAKGTGRAGLPLGLSSVGEQGPELAYNDGARTHIIPNGRSRQIASGLAGMGVRMPGFASGTANASRIASALMSQLGLTKNQSAGILGNLSVESGFNPLAHNARENAWGIAQWEGPRLTALQNYASAQHLSFKSLDAQIGYLIKELRGSSVLRQIKKMSNSGSIAALVDAQFERSSGDARGQRISAAQSIAKQLASGKISSTGTGGKTGLTQVANSSAALNAYNALGKAVKLGRDATKGASTSSIVEDLQRTEAALTKAGASAKFVAGITKQNKQIAALAYARNVAASHLATATKAVTDAVATLNQDKDSFKATAVGSFDLTNAGVDENGRVSSGSLRSSQAQALTRVRAWVTGMTKLIGSKVFPAAYLRTLLGAGPASLPTVQALLGMSAADMKTFASNERTIDSLSGSIASAGAHKLDDPAINAAKITQAKDAQLEAQYQKRLEAAVDRVGDRVADELSKLNIQSKLGYKQGDLYVAVETDKKRSTHRKATSKR